MSNSPLLYNDSMYAGDGYTLTLQYLDSSEVPIDLTGAVARMQLKTNKGSSVALDMIGSTDIPTGTISFAATGVETAALVPTKFTVEYVYDVQLTLLGSEPESLLEGKIVAKKDVTDV